MNRPRDINSLALSVGEAVDALHLCDALRHIVACMSKILSCCINDTLTHVRTILSFHACFTQYCCAIVLRKCHTKRSCPVAQYSCVPGE